MSEITREPKFRGFIPEFLTGKWVYGSLDPTDLGAVILSGNAPPATVLDETVGQWTGTYDDEGKEIYEGDIVQADWCSKIACPPGPSFTGIVLYINKAAAFYVVRKDERACPLWLVLKTRVLGNVFDKEYKETFGRIWDMNGDFLVQGKPEKKERHC